MASIFISTTLFALFASMLIGLEWCGKAFPTILITDSVVRRCGSPSAAAGLPRPFLSMTTPGFAQVQSPQGPAPAKGIFEKAIHTVNK